MPIPSRKYLILGSIIVISFMGLIFWSARSAWQASREISIRHAEQIFQREDFLDDARAKILLMNNLLLIPELLPAQTESNRAKFDKLAQELTEGIENEESILPENAKLGVVRDLSVEFQEYLETAYSFMDTTQSDSRFQSLLERIQSVRAKSESVIQTLDQVSNSRAEEIETIFAEYKATQRRLYILVLLLAVFAFLLTGAAIFIVLQNRVARLRLDLARSKLSQQKQERLASLGTLASGVAHEIRNPLTAIKARIFALNKKLEPASDARNQIEAIANEINRLEKIVKEFLLFARPPKPDLQRFEVLPIFEQVNDLLRLELAERSLRLEISQSDELAAKGDPEQILQILINLIQNAADASSENQSITMTAHQVDNDMNPKGPGKIAIHVIDQGCSIPKDVAKNLFNPFFTTKPKGTGLGLSIAKRIAQANSGDLTFESGDGKGTIFKLTLPEAD